MQNHLNLHFVNRYCTVVPMHRFRSTAANSTMWHPTKACTMVHYWKPLHHSYSDSNQKTILQVNILLFVFVSSNHHAGYSNTWDAGRTPRTDKRRVNRYLIVYQKWRNWTQQTSGDDTVTAALKATNTNPRQQCPHSAVGCVQFRHALLIDNQITRSWCSIRIQCVTIPGVITTALRPNSISVFKTVYMDCIYTLMTL